MPDNVSAVHLVLTGDPALFSIVRLSLIVSLSAALFAALIGLPLGALIALTRFYGREAVIVVLNALMGLPPGVVGIAVFSRPFALRAPRIIRASIYAAGNGDRTDRASNANHCRAESPNH